MRLKPRICCFLRVKTPLKSRVGVSFSHSKDSEIWIKHQPHPLLVLQRFNITLHPQQRTLVSQECCHSHLHAIWSLAGRSISEAAGVEREQGALAIPTSKGVPLFPASHCITLPLLSFLKLDKWERKGDREKETAINSWGTQQYSCCFCHIWQQLICVTLISVENMIFILWIFFEQP